MGDPRKIRKKYETPVHPWQKERIEEEKKLSEDYGLRNKTEVWRVGTILKKFKDQVKSLASRTDKQSKLEEKQLVNKLCSYGLMTRDQPLDAVLGLNVEAVMERRLQTIVVRKGFARTMNQARQFIVHGHVVIGEKKITFPSYLVTLSEEAMVQFVPSSTLSKEDHPERIIKEVVKEKVVKKKDDSKEEAPPTFSPEEIAEIEEKGAVEKPKESDKESTDNNKKESKKSESVKKQQKTELENSGSAKKQQKTEEVSENKDSKENKEEVSKETKE